MAMARWAISRVTEADLAACAYIDVVGFENVPFVQYMFPRHLRGRQWTQADEINHRIKMIRPRMGSGTIKATGPDGTVVGYAVWPAPSVAGVTYNPLPPENERDKHTDWTAQQHFRNLLGEHAIHTMGKRKHWCLVKIATHPEFKRQGVASALMNWGLKQADAEGLPTMLEAVPASVPLYTQAGFKEVDQIRFPYAERDFDGVETGEQGEIHLVVMVREPEPVSSLSSGERRSLRETQ